MINEAHLLAKQLRIKTWQSDATIALFDDGNTVPFIARYRKEATGGLTDEQVHNLYSGLKKIRAIDERRETIKKQISAQGKLTDKISEKIDTAVSLSELEDIYAPYKKKRQTRGAVARQQGLGPLAMHILRQTVSDQTLSELADPFLSPTLPTVGHVWQGARDIVAEAISDQVRVRRAFRRRAFVNGKLTCQKIEKSIDEDKTFQTYYQFNQQVGETRPHQTLAINRGEKEGILRVRVDLNETDKLLCIRKISRPNPASTLHDQLEKATQDSLKRLLMPAVERDVRRLLNEKAEDHAINVFAKNLHGLLSQPPLAGYTILGIDPGFRSGCKLAVIDETGHVLETGMIYLRRKDEAIKRLMLTIQRHQVNLIAIGNGTGSRETEKLVAEVINILPDSIQFLVVNEAGASVYSASEVARKELPDMDVGIRGAVSIGRRVQDPLAEFVKIDPKSIGVGLYQHDVNQKKLSTSLDGVVELVVNRIGVDVNTASPSLLTHISGIGPTLAERIVDYRDENGAFPNRNQLKKVSGIGQKVYEQAAGFLRIHNGDNAFDSTSIHPESYKIAKSILKRAGTTLEATPTKRQAALDALPDFKSLAQEIGIGKPTLVDIVAQLKNPGRDPRDLFDKPILRSDVLSMDDLEAGQILQGTVRNVVDFGAFIDIGVKRDGLLHHSLLPKKNELTVGKVVNVKIKGVDDKRGRISLVWP